MAKIDETMTDEEDEFVATYSRSSIPACGGKFLRPITEGGFVASVKEAIRWIKSVNADPNEHRRINVTGLYKQLQTGHSILLFYTVSDKSETVEKESILVKNEDLVD